MLFFLCQEHPKVSCLLLLIQYTFGYLQYLETCLHLEPEDAPCCGQGCNAVDWFHLAHDKDQWHTSEHTN